MGTTMNDTLKNIKLTLKSMEYKYPNIIKWFENDVKPNLGNNRNILFVMDNSELVAFAILKSGDENKISTFYVGEQHRRNGVGTTLMKLCIEQLKTDVNITVSEHDIDSFRKLLNNYNFVEIGVICGEFTDGVNEHHFYRE